MIRRVMMLLLIMLMLMLANVAWAGELRQVSEAPVGKYYFDGTYSIGSSDKEMILGILFVPTVKGDRNTDHTVFMYLINLDEGTCICTERKDYNSNKQLYKEHHYERLISVPIEKVDSIVNALKIINEQSIEKLDNNRFSLSNALTGVQYINDWLKSFRDLTKLASDRVSPEEKQQIGNLGVEMQALGFYNWPKTVEGTLRKQEYEICKLEYELAIERNATGKVSKEEVAEKEKRYQETKSDIQNFLAKFHVAD
ncbi:MAG: hypothetical protein H6Q68_818 [Firmicutes bacterium]|nr:hypothetical protein [Bacillota bacterium]